MKFLAILIICFPLVSFGQSAKTINSYVGLHLLSSNEIDQKYLFISSDPSNNQIENLIRSLDWVNEFHQIVLVTSPNISIEVGGSMSPSDGLSSVFRDLDKRIYSVTEYPPTNIGQMLQILKLFKAGDNKWESLYGFKKIPY